MSRPSNLEFALLGLLRQQPQSGYDLRKAFVTTALRHYSDSPGSIYPALRRLQNSRSIAVDATYRKQSADRRGRTVYHVTKQGLSAFKDWLARSVTRDDVIWSMPELMLRFAFMDGNVPRAISQRFLAQFEEILIGYVSELRASFDQANSTGPVNTSLLAFQCGIEQMESQIDWARRARACLVKDTQ
jgi:DNA-binding PadR family transcriptional regulator